MSQALEQLIANLRERLVSIPDGEPFTAPYISSTLNLTPKAGDRYAAYLPYSSHLSQHRAQWYVYQPDQSAIALANELEKLIEFKSYVHDRLNDMGVPYDNPTSEHSKAGCRIGARLDMVEEAVMAAKMIAEASW